VKKILITSIFIVLLLVSITVPVALALVSQSAEYYVTDSANVLTAVTRQDIVDMNVDLERECKGAQVVIVTVKYLDGIPSDEYATRLFNDWQVGPREANNGMLLLLATEELKGWLVVGDGISGIWDGDMVDKYLDKYFWPEVDARNYDTAVRNICEALYSWYAGYYGIDQQGSQSGNNYVPQPTTGSGNRVPDPYPVQQPPRQTVWSSIASFFVLVPIFIIIGVFILIIIIISASADRRRYRSYHMSMGVPMPR